MGCGEGDDLRGLIEAHMAQSQERHAVLMSRFDDAFPHGDVHGHREAHEAMIAREKADTEFWTKLKYELTSKGLLIFLAWLGWQAWTGFLNGPGK
jgi:hypothetical protein